MARELKVEFVRKQGLELQADEGTLGNDGAVLLLDREEVLVGLAVGEDDGLAAQGANLCAADVEHVAVAGEIGQGDVVALGHQTIAQAGSVNVEGNVIALANLIYIVQFVGGVEGAQLGGEGDVDESGVDGVVAVAVVHEVVQILVQHAGLHLAVGVGDGDNLVLGELDGTGLVDVDMA